MKVALLDLKKIKIPFYIELGVALLSLVGAIVYRAGLASLGDVVSNLPLILILCGVAAFAVLSLVEMPGMGASLLAIADFVALLVFVGTIYPYPMEQVMVAGTIMGVEKMSVIIAAAALMLLGALLSAVLSWIPMLKKGE